MGAASGSLAATGFGRFGWRFVRCFCRLLLGGKPCKWSRPGNPAQAQLRVVAQKPGHCILC